MKKSKKGGNRRLVSADSDDETSQVVVPVLSKMEVSDKLRQIAETEDIDELLELSRCENEQVRLKASQQMCPCRVKTDQPDFWERLFELA